MLWQRRSRSRSRRLATGMVAVIAPTGAAIKPPLGTPRRKSSVSPRMVRCLWLGTGFALALFVANACIALLEKQGFRRFSAHWGKSGGEGGIRTHVTVAGKPHFECGAFDHSATSPRGLPRLSELLGRSSGQQEAGRLAEGLRLAKPQTSHKIRAYLAPAPKLCLFCAIEGPYSAIWSAQSSS